MNNELIEENLETICIKKASLIILMIKAHIGGKESLKKQIEDELISLSMFSFQRGLEKARGKNEQSK